MERMLALVVERPVAACDAWSATPRRRVAPSNCPFRRPTWRGNPTHTQRPLSNEGAAATVHLPVSLADVCPQPNWVADGISPGLAHRNDQCGAENTTTSPGSGPGNARFRCGVAPKTWQVTPSCRWPS